MKSSQKYAKIDYVLLFMTILLVVLGVVMVYSTSYYNMLIDHRSPDFLFKSSLNYAIIGIVVMIVVSMINYRFFKYVAPFMYVVATLLSIVVLLVGEDFKGGTRWIIIPFLNISFMPSELTKIAIILTFAWYIGMAGKRIGEFSHFLKLFVLLGILAGLTIFQRDLSTTALIVALGVSMMFIGKCRFRYLFITMAICVCLLAGYLHLFPYSMDRINVWTSSVTDRVYEFDDGKYQIMYSVYAIGSGGLTGKGFGMGELKFMRLPEPYNDFIFAIICEEFGLWGALLVLLIFVIILHRIFAIAMATKDHFSYLVASGTGLLIAYQVIINIGVVTNILPTTGITLPFVSKGGTSVVILMFLIGVVLNISMHNDLDEVSQ